MKVPIERVKPLTCPHAVKWARNWFGPEALATLNKRGKNGFGYEGYLRWTTIGRKRIKATIEVDHKTVLTEITQ